jgi:hypothetical protein
MKTVNEESSALPERPNPADLVPEVSEDDVSLVEEAEENPGFFGEFLTTVFGAAVGFIAAGFLNNYLMPTVTSALGGNATIGAAVLFGAELAGAAALIYFTRNMKSAMLHRVIGGVSVGVALAGVGTLATQLMSGTASPATSIRNAPGNLMTGGLTRRNRAITV